MLRMSSFVESAAEKGDDRVEIVKDEQACVIALADGAGGRAGGAAAAEAVVRSVRAGFANVDDRLNPAHWDRVLADADQFISADPACGERRPSWWRSHLKGSRAQALETAAQE